jgi:hypothetical protein
VKGREPELVKEREPALVKEREPALVEEREPAIHPHYNTHIQDRNSIRYSHNIVPPWEHSHHSHNKRNPRHRIHLNNIPHLQKYTPDPGCNNSSPGGNTFRHLTVTTTSGGGGDLDRDRSRCCRLHGLTGGGGRGARRWLRGCSFGGWRGR